jgi:hypothetical protein
MSDQLTCPNCGSSIKLTESLAKPFVEATRRDLERQIESLRSEAKAREAAMQVRQRELDEKAAAVEAEVQAKLSEARAAIAKEEGQRAKLLLRDELEAKARETAGLQAILRERDAKLAEAQRVQADMMRKQRELEDKERELDLTLEKKLSASQAAIREQAKADAQQAELLKHKEKDELLASMQRKIEELSRKAEQGSQQLQGEVLELEIETRLKSHFPHDIFESVPKGRHGGDILHHVHAPNGHRCGTILWETKRTKTWSNGWLGKLRDDQRAAKADVALIATMALPSGVQTFDQLEGVWVASYHCIIPVAVALRHSLVELARERRRMAGQNSKMEMVYDYLTGNEFRQRVGAIVERFDMLREELKKEREFMERKWSAREKILNGVLSATSGMYGDLQGIAGSEMPEIESLEQPLLSKGKPAELTRAAE